MNERFMSEFSRLRLVYNPVCSKGPLAFQSHTFTEAASTRTLKLASCARPNKGELCRRFRIEINTIIVQELWDNLSRQLLETPTPLPL